MLFFITFQFKTHVLVTDSHIVSSHVHASSHPHQPDVAPQTVQHMHSSDYHLMSSIPSNIQQQNSFIDAASQEQNLINSVSSSFQQQQEFLNTAPSSFQPQHEFMNSAPNDVQHQQEFMSSAPNTFQQQQDFINSVPNNFQPQQDFINPASKNIHQGWNGKYSIVKCKISIHFHLINVIDVAYSYNPFVVFMKHCEF